MSQIRRFEEMSVWRAAHRVARDVYMLTNSEPFRRDFSFRDQIRRAAVSIPSNIAEGYERDGDREFLQFLSTAKGSAGELRSQLCLAKDLGLIGEQQFEAMRQSLESVSRQLMGFMKYLRQSGMRGQKFTPKTHSPAG